MSTVAEGAQAERIIFRKEEEEGGIIVFN